MERSFASHPSAGRNTRTFSGQPHSANYGFSGSPVPSVSHYGKTGTHHNDVTRRIEREVWHILQWNNPVRSGAYLGLILGTLVLIGSYSPLQICSAILTVLVGLNLLYVSLTTQTHRVFSNDDIDYTSRDVLAKEPIEIDRSQVRHYTNLLVDVTETVVHALSRIVLIEDSTTSLKWLAISYLTWVISGHVSSRVLAIMFVISAFSFPRLYMSNKDVLDARINQGETLLKQSINQSQAAATESVHNVVDKAKHIVGLVNEPDTTKTDLKNTKRHTTVVAK
ncbi:Reticulon-domain-containing protein [Phycomyces blakesleeanus]|uniref:Reticulon-like protein n=1 Tax=Phycomyces blakesleeanus TaxID=4837 RepID=A0ABR3AHU3_PHYBL